MTPRLRKAVLSIHLTLSVGWIGAVVAYLALGLTAVRTNEDQTIRSAWIAMETVGWYATVPLAVLSLLTGIVLAFGTRWGLLRHYWVVISLVLTTIAAGVLVLHMPDVSTAATIARTATPQELRALGGDLAHPAVGLVILLAVQILNIYKPRGLTLRGVRHQGQTARRRHRHGDAAQDTAAA